MNHEWEIAFNEIVDHMEFEYEVPPLQAGEINRAIMGANEVATYLGKILSMLLAQPDSMITINQDTANAIRELIDLTDAISADLSDCQCPDCRDCECTDEEICDECMEFFGDDDEEEDD